MAPLRLNTRFSPAGLVDEDLQIVVRALDAQMRAVFAELCGGHALPHAPAADGHGFSRLFGFSHTESHDADRGDASSAVSSVAGMRMLHEQTFQAASKAAEACLEALDGTRWRECLARHTATTTIWASCQGPSQTRTPHAAW